MTTYFLFTMIFILYAHLVGDFVLQTDWMATNKSSSLTALSVHVGVYTLVMAIASIAFHSASPVSFVIVNGILHFATDSITSRISASYWKREERHAFFVTIGIDQFIHAVTLLVTAYLFV